DLELEWLGALEGHALTVVGDLDRVPCPKRVARPLVLDVHDQPSPAIGQAIAEPPDRAGQTRHEGEVSLLVAQAAETGYGSDARACQRGDVDAVTRVVLE